MSTTLLGSLTRLLTDCYGLRYFTLHAKHLNAWYWLQCRTQFVPVLPACSVELEKTPTFFQSQCVENFGI